MEGAAFAMNTWQGFGDFGPETRAGFLDWLSEGADGGVAELGYLSLYLAGMEHRLFFDGDCGLAEKREIASEIGRLMDETASSTVLDSFKRKSMGTSMGVLRAYANLAACDFEAPVEAPATPGPKSLTLPLKVALGHQISSARKVTAEQGLAIFMGIASPAPYAARRSRREFGELFRSEVRREASRRIRA